MDESWTTIESDPGVFTELLTSIGVKGVQLEELWDGSAESFRMHAPVFGVVFLFKWGGEAPAAANATGPKPTPASECPGLYFANQIVNNACATQALISILMNAHEKIELGETLKTFRAQTLNLDPKLRGISIGNNETIRKAHNSFRQPDVITVVDNKATEPEDSYHFIAYLPFGGHLYEIDGLQAGPIDWGELKDEDWIDKVSVVIQERIARYADAETGFNIMALVGNKKDRYEKELFHLTNYKSAIESKLAGTEFMHVDGFDLASVDLSGTPEQLQEKLIMIDAQITELQIQIVEEESKYASWKEENIRRRHNYVPFLFHLLKALASKGHLTSLIDQAKAKAEARYAKKSASSSK